MSVGFDFGNKIFHIVVSHGNKGVDDGIMHEFLKVRYSIIHIVAKDGVNIPLLVVHIYVHMTIFGVVAKIELPIA